ncbi:hypothetical protein SprV_0200669600 [Sparganum proliferum]
MDYKADGYFLHSRQTQALTRFSTTNLRDLLLADDCALESTTEEDMQRSTDPFFSVCAHSGLTISTDKTVTLHKQLSDVEYCVLHICVKGTEL